MGTCQKQVSLTFFLLLLYCSNAWSRHMQQLKEEIEKTEFLAGEVPLEILATTPALLTSTRTDTIEMSGKQSITVLFSRPVVHFGQSTVSTEENKEQIPFTLDPPIPGKFTWVTTYIIRWEPEAEWSLNQQVVLTWNKDLITYDGVGLTLKVPTTANLATQSLSIMVTKVLSNVSQIHADGQWDAFAGTSMNALPEVPPDGVVELHFSAPVKFSVIKNNLQVMNIAKDTPTLIKLDLKPCVVPEPPCLDCEQKEEDTIKLDDVYSLGFDSEYTDDADITVEEEIDCLNITLSGELQSNTRYAFILDSGIEYNPNSGRLTERIEAQFGGLRTFQIPFREDKDIIISNPNLNIWAPHGIRAILPDKGLSNFPMKLTDADSGIQSEFEIKKINNATYRISSSLLPGESYRMTVYASTGFVDGYNQPLIGSVILFNTQEINAIFSAATVSFDTGLAVFESGQEWGKKVLAFNKGDLVFSDEVCKGGAVLNIWQVNDFTDVLPLFYSTVYNNSAKEFLGSTDDTLNPPGKDLIGEVTEMDVSDLLKGTGVLVHEYCRSEQYNTQVIVESDLQVVAVMSETRTKDGPQAIIWVTSMNTGEAIPKATITVYQKIEKGVVDLEGYEKIGSAETDTNGVAMVNMVEGAEALHIMVDHNGKVIYIPDVHVESVTAAANLYNTIILDRRLVRPGETLFIKGYVLMREGDSVVPALFKSSSLEISPPLSFAGEAKETYEIEVNKKFGSFDASILIPTSVSPGEYTITFEGISKTDTTVGSSETFIVNIPQPPTVKLSVETPVWVAPDGKVSILVQAESFIGSSVSNSDMMVTWNITDMFRSPDDEKLTGALRITTDLDGQAKGTIDLSSFQNTPSPGTVLEGLVSWYSPTQEMVEKPFSVKLEFADIDLQLKRSIATDIPGQNFAVSLSAKDFSGNDLKDIKLEIKLKELGNMTAAGLPVLKQETGNKEIEGDVISSCPVKSSTDVCDFSLKGMGEYVIEACLSGKKSDVCKRIFLGKTEEQWATKPLREFLPVSFYESSVGPYKVGDKAKFIVVNPYEKAQLLMTTGNVNNMITKVVPLDDFKQNEISFEVGKECQNNCGISMVMSIPRQTKGAAADLEIPVSKLFDPAMPHVQTFSTVLTTLHDNTLKMSVQFPDAIMQNGIPVMEPFQNTSIRVNFDSQSSTEITVIVVNKAILDLIPYDLPKIDEDFLIDFAVAYTFKDSSKYLIAPKAIQSLIDNFEERKKIDPWFNILSELNPTVNNEAIDYSAETYTDIFSQYITVVPFATLASNVTNTTTVTETNSQKMDLRLPFNTLSTPLFSVDEASGGVLYQVFRSPVTPGTFVVRAYGATGTGRFGSAEGELVVQKKINIESALPKFVRAYDEFSSGVTVTSPTPIKGAVTITVEVTEPLVLVGESKVKVEADNAYKVQAFFSFSASGMGEAVVRYTADNGKGLNDILEVTVPVLGFQSASTISYAFVAEATTNTLYQEIVTLPKALPGSGTITVTAGMRKEPGIASLSKEIYNSNPNYKCPLTADTLLGAIVIPGVINQYDPWSPDPNLIEKLYVELIDSIYPYYEQSVILLAENYTSNVFGLEPTQLCPGEIFIGEKSVDLEQNAKGIWAVNEVENDLKGTRMKDIKSLFSTISELRDTWYSILETSLVEAATKASANGTSIDLRTIAICRAALGALWVPPKGTSDKVVNDLSIRRLSAEFAKMDLEGQGWYILSLLAEKDGKKNKDVTSALDTWSKLFTQYDRVAFITDGPDSISPASNLGNSLAALAIIRSGSTNKELSKLVSYAAGPLTDTLGFKVFTNFEKIVSMIALREYDNNFKTKDINVRLALRSGTTILLSYVFNDPTRPVSIQNTPFDMLDSVPKPIEFAAVGLEEVFVAISLTFVSSEVNPYPMYSGIYVERSIQLDSSEDSNSGSLVNVPVESIVYVKIQIIIPEDLGETVVSVPLPAGLEPISAAVDGPNSCPVPFFDLLTGVYSECPEQQILDSEVIFTYTSLSAGTHSLTFKAVAATAGSFTMPPTKVYATQQSDVIGLSGAGSFEICSGRTCKAMVEDKAFNAKSCPAFCSENGVCDLFKGSCVCFEGFKGPACENISI